tara:strand:- start:74 stop:262 length:189 start_codon:yes stop_codon:yes gene_type:complete
MRVSVFLISVFEVIFVLVELKERGEKSIILPTFRINRELKKDSSRADRMERVAVAQLMTVGD